MTVQIDFDTIDRLRKGKQETRSRRSRDTFRELARTYPDRKKILAEGDSWLAYPPKFILFGAANNIVDCLKDKYNDYFIINDIASNGDEAVAMLVGDSKMELLRRLSEDSFDILLFSGGGNDIVGRYDFDYFLLPKTASNTWKDCINELRFRRRLEQIERSYADLVDLTLEYSVNPDIRIVTHTYDLAIPSKEGATFFGGLLQVDNGRSWMYPYLVDKGIDNSDDQRAIAHYMIGEFKNVLDNIAADVGVSLIVVDTQGTVTSNEWLNEIHPDSQGFTKITDKIFEQGLRPLL